MTKKLLTLMLVLCLLVTSVMIPSYANNSEAIDNPEYDNLTGLSLKGEEEQKEEETGESEFAFSNAIALGTHVFDYVDRKQFEESGHVARLEPLEELNTYVFANEDGTQTMYMMAENVKFVAEDGNIREKNIKLIKIEDHYETEDNNVSIFIPDDYSEGVRISFGEDYIFMKAEGENSEAITDEKNNTVTYKNIFGEGIDSYLLLGNTIQESVDYASNRRSSSSGLRSSVVCGNGTYCIY